MDRRSLLKLAAPAAAAVFGLGDTALASAAPNFDRVERELAKFRALPGTPSYVIDVSGPVKYRAEHQQDIRMFAASATKTFILATYLQKVEAGLLSEDEKLPVNNDIRALGSPVFIDLSGEIHARHALEAMISHSDNTATDMALARVGVNKVRAFIAEAGLAVTQIPDSTRIMGSYFAGAPFGVDEGWKGMKRLRKGHLFGNPRSALNRKCTMASTAGEFASYYRRAMRGEFFQSPETLTEFKRILATSDLILQIAPPDTPIYGKSGNATWLEFSTRCLAGQMVVNGKSAVTFAFILNWERGDIDHVVATMFDIMRGVMREIKKAAT
jgi:beta-lactamase class A